MSRSRGQGSGNRETSKLARSLNEYRKQARKRQQKDAATEDRTMTNLIDKSLGIFPKSLELRSRKAEIISNNLANGDTPGFMARDIDFKSVLSGMTGGNGKGVGNSLPMAATSGQHLSLSPGPEMDADLMYRLPSQPSVDGNTVDVNRERSEFFHNTTQYQASITFINSRLKGLMTAIKGGE